MFHPEIFDPEKLIIMRTAEASLDRARELLTTIQAVGDEEAPIVEALAKYADDMIQCYSEMIIACTDDSEKDPFIRDGLVFLISQLFFSNYFCGPGVPKVGTQRVMAQLGAIGLTIEFIDCLLCDPPSALDDDPGSGVPYKSITSTNSKRAILLLFRFLRQIVKANNIRAHVALLERHLDFLYKHLNSDFKVVICAVSVCSESFSYGFT